MVMPTLRRVDGEWRARLIHAFQVHVRSEHYVLEDYQKLIEATTDRGTRFLLEQILADERRHHELFIALTNDALASSSGPEAPEIPAPRPDPGEAAELLEATSRFLAIERDDRAQLRSLRREASMARNESLWPIVLEVMEADTAKHIRLLQELRSRLRHAAAAPPEIRDATRAGS
jgi:hypothetical protein